MGDCGQLLGQQLPGRTKKQGLLNYGPWCAKLSACCVILDTWTAPKDIALDKIEDKYMKRVHIKCATEPAIVWADRQWLEIMMVE